MNERRFSKTVRANVALEWRAKSAGHMKTTQCSKIRELRQALVKAGHLTLDQQAESLGLARSTAWAILRGNHKHSGLSAATIKRMLSSQQLPPPIFDVCDTSTQTAPILANVTQPRTWFWVSARAPFTDHHSKSVDDPELRLKTRRQHSQRQAQAGSLLKYLISPGRVHHGWH